LLFTPFEPAKTFIGLVASLGLGAATELLRRAGSPNNEESSTLIMNEANIKRLVNKLSKMRGAALKMGQFLSIQGNFLQAIFQPSLAIHSLDTHILPPEVDKIFRRVQDSAHYMPDWQMEVQ
jgi:aarF domain-containing kinase